MTNLTTHQMTSLSALICNVEKIAESGVLPEQDEAVLRWIITQNHIAFGMPTKYERKPIDIMDLHDRTVSLIKSWVEQDNTSTSEYDAQLDQVRMEIGGRA